MIRRTRTFDTGPVRSWAVDEECAVCGRRIQCATDIPADRLRSVHREYGCGQSRSGRRAAA